MARELILDTGALVSLLDRSQEQHAACVTFYEQWSGAVVSTEAVLTEATHLLGRIPGGRETCVRFFAEGGATLVPTSTAALRRCLSLMRRCAAQPMDFADATLVVLADELGTDQVFTIDHDFDVYRLPDGRPLRRLPTGP